MASAIHSKVTPLGERHAQITVTERLAFITKALKTQSVNRLVALYAGFDCLESAERFEEYVVLNWGKTSYEVQIRPGKRTASKWEVKVRKPSEAQLQSLVHVATHPAIVKTPYQVSMAEMETMRNAAPRGRKAGATYRGVSVE
jgi:hypothetical protein